MILDYGPPDDGLYAARSYADLELSGGAEIRVKFALWWKGVDLTSEDDYITLEVTPVFSVQNGVDHNVLVITRTRVAYNSHQQAQLKAELLDAIHGKAQRELAFLGLADDTGL